MLLKNCIIYSTHTTTDTNINTECIEDRSKIIRQDLFHTTIEPIASRLKHSLDHTILNSLSSVPNHKISHNMIERYRCSKCDFYHNKKSFLTRHIHIHHKGDASSCIPVRQMMKVVMKRKPIKKALDSVDKEVMIPNRANLSGHKNKDIQTQFFVDKESTSEPIKNKKIVYPTIGVRFKCPYCKFHSKEKAIVVYHTKTNHKEHDTFMPPIRQEMMVGLCKSNGKKEIIKEKGKDAHNTKDCEQLKTSGVEDVNEVHNTVLEIDKSANIEVNFVNKINFYFFI